MNYQLLFVKISPSPGSVDVIAALGLGLLFLATVLQLVPEVAEIDQALFLGSQPLDVVVLTGGEVPELVLVFLLVGCGGCQADRAEVLWGLGCGQGEGLLLVGPGLLLEVA